MADKAFLCGINEYKSIGDLRGCINDLETIRDLLISQFAFKPTSIRLKKNRNVTKDEVTKGWNWLLTGAKPGDRLVFHFSGHGSYTVDLDGDEENGFDELLCLYDMDWGDPDSYLLDDELRVWTEQIPAGVSVTFIFDCCHSGTGTRMVLPPAAARSVAGKSQSLVLVDLETSLDRLQVDRQTRSLTAESEAKLFDRVVPATTDLLTEASVLARFAPPPADIQAAVGQAKQRQSFGSVFQDATRTADADMNHVLWAGCRDDQTAADAYIANDFHGAFSYYFAETVRQQADQPGAKAVIQAVRRKLQDERFHQVPQLEPAHTDGVLFTVDHAPQPTPAVTDAEPAPADINAQLVTLLQQLQQLLQLLLPPSREDLTVTRSGSRGLVYVHGICEHPATYSDPWWASLAPHLSHSTRAALGANRAEVLWSQHVSATTRSVMDPLEEAEYQQLSERLRDVLQERAILEASERISEGDDVEQRSRGPVPRAMLGVPGLDCVDDFVKYWVSNSIRSRVIAEFVNMVRPMLARGESVEVISHSWGTVVAYEALRQLESEDLPGRIHNWFTVGAALAIAFVARRLRPRDGRKPSNVQRWVNLDARGDIVGGSLRAVGLQVDHESLDLLPTGCPTFARLVSPACSHGSYFKPDNTAVNRDTFARWIESP